MRVVTKVLLGGWAVMAMANGAAAAGNDHRLAVRLYDGFGVSSAHLDRARSAANDILKHAGLAINWHGCGRYAQDADELGCGAVAMSREVVVRIVKSTPLTNPRFLGESVIDPDGNGVLATVYADHVIAVATAAGSDVGTVLGRTIAHEIGHLLLGSARHAVQGLMRASWSVDDLRANRPGDWLVSGEEATLMRRRLDGWSLASLSGGRSRPASGHSD